MASYVERVREEIVQSRIRQLEELDKQWSSSDHTASALRKLTGDKNLEAVPLRDFLKFQGHSDRNQMPSFLVRFLIDISGLIVDWELGGLDENCTVPEALTALKIKARELEPQQETSPSTV